MAGENNLAFLSSSLLPLQGLIWSLRASGDWNPLNVKNRVELLETGPLPSPLPHGCQPLPLFMQHSRRDFSAPLPIRLHCRTTPRPLQIMHFPCIGITLLCFPVLPVPAFPLFLIRLKVSVGFIHSPRGCCSSASLTPPIDLQQGTSQLLSPQNIGLYHCELFKPLGEGETILTKPRAACWWHGEMATCRMLYSIDSAREHHLPRQRFYWTRYAMVCTSPSYPQIPKHPLLIGNISQKCISENYRNPDGSW